MAEWHGGCKTGLHGDHQHPGVQWLRGGPSSIGLELPARGFFVCVTRSATHAVFCTVRPATGLSAGAPGPPPVDPSTPLNGLKGATPRSCAHVRVRVCLGRIRHAGLLGVFWCGSPFLWPLFSLSLFAFSSLGWIFPILRCCLTCLTPCCSLPFYALVLLSPKLLSQAHLAIAANGP